MTTSPHWLVVKYMPDRRRREPRNVGVIVSDGRRIEARFLGEDAAGELDLRRVPRWVKSRSTFRTWVRYLRDRIPAVSATDLGELIGVVSGSNYVVEPGGIELVPAAAPELSALRDELFTLLVSADADVEELGSGVDLKAQCEQVLAPIITRYHINRDIRLPYYVDDRYEDPLRFHYGLKNGRWHYMRRVWLGTGDDRTWEQVHATRYVFQRLREHPDQAHSRANTVCLFLSAPDNEDAENQLGVLAKESEIVDVSHLEAASQTLREMVTSN